MYVMPFAENITAPKRLHSHSGNPFSVTDNTISRSFHRNGAIRRPDIFLSQKRYVIIFFGKVMVTNTFYLLPIKT